MKKCFFPLMKKENELLLHFFSISQGKSEVARIEFAKELHMQWKEANCSPLGFPGVPERDDYWYLVQIFALNRHSSTHQPRNPAEFFAEKEIFYETSFGQYKDNGRLLRYDELLQMAVVYGTNELSFPIALDGKWCVPGKGSFDLLGGDPVLGGARFIDAIWDHAMIHKIHRVYVSETK